MRRGAGRREPHRFTMVATDDAYDPSEGHPRYQQPGGPLRGAWRMSKHPDTCMVVGCEGTVVGFAELTADFPLPGKGGLAVVVSVCDGHFEVLEEQWATGTRLDEGSAAGLDRL